MAKLRPISGANAGVTLKGDKALDALLAQLPKRAAKRVLGKALRAGAKPIQKEAKRIAPKDKHELAKSITVRKGKRKRKDGQSVVVFPDPLRFKDYFHAPAVEFGTAHTEAQPYMRPAWENKKEEALGIVTAEVKAGVAAEAKALKK